MVRELDGHPGAVGLVAGATRSEVLAGLRAEAPDQWFLVPGVGAQGGDLEAVKALGDRAIVNASRSILYASSGDDFAEAAQRAAVETRDALRN
jgi:orotidine-5'-phosphate decarboxylase